MFKAFKIKPTETESLPFKNPQVGLTQYSKYIYDPSPMSHDFKEEELINEFTNNGYMYITKLSNVYKKIISVLTEETTDFSSFCFNSDTADGISSTNVKKQLDTCPAVFYFKDTDILHSLIVFNAKDEQTVYIHSFCVNQILKLKGGKNVLEEFIDIIKKVRFEKIELNSIHSAVRFYEKMGFVVDNAREMTETPLMTKDILRGGKTKRRKTKRRKTKRRKTKRRKTKRR